MIDKEDQRFVLKGTSFNPLEIINVLTIQRGYKMEYNPQQHGIPLKQGNLDDKYENDDNQLLTAKLLCDRFMSLII